MQFGAFLESAPRHVPPSSRADSSRTSASHPDPGWILSHSASRTFHILLCVTTSSPPTRLGCTGAHRAVRLGISRGRRIGLAGCSQPGHQKGKANAPQHLDLLRPGSHHQALFRMTSRQKTFVHVKKLVHAGQIKFEGALCYLAGNMGL